MTVSWYQCPVWFCAKISSDTVSISQANFLFVFYDTKEYKLCFDVKCLLIHGHNWISFWIHNDPFWVVLQKIGGWCEAVQCKLHLLYSHNVVYENILLATAYLSERNTDWIGTDPHVDTLWLFHRFESCNALLLSLKKLWWNKLIMIIYLKWSF